MDKLDKYQIIKRLLDGRRTPVALDEFAQRLNCSHKTARKLIKEYIDKYSAPIQYLPAQKGYKIVDEETTEMPGMWFSSNEIQRLVLLLEIVVRLGDGVLDESIAPIRAWLNSEFSKRSIDPAALQQRLKVIPIAYSQPNISHFNALIHALLQRTQLDIRYEKHNQVTRRDISPQTLVYYRNNWYVDAWCHLRKQPRTFLIARIKHCNTLTAPAKEVPKQELSALFESSYGIFSGAAKNTANIVFFDHAAFEVSEQCWHPEQQGQWLNKEQYQLSLPYSDERELIRDIIKYGDKAKVIAPEILQTKIKDTLKKSLALY